jgi:flagellar basal-body rod modification protein FlgD
MPISAINSFTSTQPIASAMAPKTLGSADFMKLLAVQFKSQDPMKPMEDTAFIAQMAQFTALEQSQSLTTEMAKLSTGQQLATANTYLGQQVTVDTGKGGTANGLVSAVQINKDGPSIIVGGVTYPLSAVLLVQPAPGPTAISASTPTNV